MHYYEKMDIVERIKLITEHITDKTVETRESSK